MGSIHVASMYIPPQCVAPSSGKPTAIQNLVCAASSVGSHGVQLPGFNWHSVKKCDPLLTLVVCPRMQHLHNAYSSKCAVNAALWCTIAVMQIVGVRAYEMLSIIVYKA
jgi:hypothetical protein